MLGGRDAKLRHTVRPLLLAAAALTPAWAGAQDWVPWGSATNFVNITDAKVEQLSNAVRIVLTADGVLRTSIDFSQYFRRLPGSRNWGLVESRQLTIFLLNARSQVGRFVDVGMYPVSHVTLSVPPAAREGVGLVVGLRLYVPGRGGRIQNGDEVEDWTWRDDDPTAALRMDMVLSEDGRQLIITAFSDLHYDAPETDGRGTTAKESVMVEGSATSCRVRALNASFQSLVEAITEATGVQVTLSPGVVKRQTVDLPPMPVERVLSLLCHAACMDLAERNGQFFINEGTITDVASYWAAGGRRMRLNYLAVNDALKILPAFMLKCVRTDVESNTLTAFGPPALLDKIEHDLAVLDQPGRQVRVRAMLVEAAASGILDRYFSGLVADGNTSVELQPLEGALRVGVTKESLSDIRLALRSLDAGQRIRADVQPEVAVLSGREASVFVGEQVYFSYLRETWRGPMVALMSVPVGMALYAVPWTGDGETITVPYSITADTITARDSAGLPTISKQSGEGSLRIRSGETIIFSGMRLREASRETHALSPLDEAPLVGGLLQDRSARVVEHEIVVCLSAEAMPQASLSQPASRGESS